MDKIYLSVVIPCYNEMVNLQKGVLDKIESFLSKKDFSYEIIIVDDGSTDESIEFIEDFIKTHNKFKLIKNSHTGKAGAVSTGILRSKGEYRLFTDMDQAAPIEELDKLLPHIKDFDIVIGSRSSTRKGAPFTRAVMAKGMIILRTIIVGVRGVKDTQCGFKLFNKKSAEDLFERVKKIHKGFKQISGSAVTAGFDIELLHLAQKRNYKIKEVPIKWLYVETRRVNPVSDSIKGFFDLLKIKGNDIQGKYK